MTGGSCHLGGGFFAYKRFLQNINQHGVSYEHKMWEGRGS